MEEYIRFKEVEKIFGKEGVNAVRKHCNFIKTKKISSAICLYNTQDIEHFIKNKFVLVNANRKCKICGTNKNLSSNNTGVVYNICKSCESKRKSAESVKNWENNNLRRVKASETLKNYNASRHLIALDKFKKSCEEYGLKVLSNRNEYKKTKKIKIECSCKNVYEIYPHNGIIKCENCRIHASRLKEEDFFAKCAEIHSEYCSYENTVFKTLQEDIEVVDKKYGKYIVNAGLHYRGQGLHSSRKCSGVSKEEKLLVKQIRQYYNGTIEFNKKILKCSDNKKENKEIDIYFPDFNFGVEYNGLFNHCYFSSRNNCLNDKNYHKIKTELAIKQNIKLIHVSSFQFKEKNNIVHSIIKQNLHLFARKLFARKCIVQEIDSKTSNEFLIQNHIQGKANSSVKLGLFYNDELVEVMTFGKPRMSNKFEWELIRLASKLDTVIIGGANKIFSFFINTYKPTSIISYCDRSLFTGNIYSKLGFTFSHNTQPGYYYVKDGQLLHRQLFQKHLLKDKLNVFDNTKTEWENMFANGYNRYYDSGNSVFYYISK